LCGLFQHPASASEYVAITGSLDGSSAQTVPQSLVMPPKYEFATQKASMLVKRLGQQFPKLAEICRVVTGVQIGGTEMYRGKPVKEWFYKEAYDFRSTFPSVQISSIDRFSLPKPARGILFNYALASEITSKTQKSAIVLKKYEPFLHVRKIFVRQSASRLTATIGESGFCAEYSAFSLISDTHSLSYLLGLLNSRLLTYYALETNIILHQAGTQPQIRKSGIETLPLRTINISDPADKARHDKMVRLVESMLALHKHKAAARTQAEQEQIQRQIDATDRQIDTLVYELYGLTSKEIAVVASQK
jgi:hypothetical protein